MKAKQPVLIWTCISLVLLIFLFPQPYCTGNDINTGERIGKRPDVISITAMSAFGRLERPQVVFLHDLHTRALVSESSDCLFCHLNEDGSLSLSFKQYQTKGASEISDKIALMDLYHQNCTGCHRERLFENKKSGPITCGGCHAIDSRTMSSARPVGFDRLLHYRHEKAAGGKCGTCHHAYDKDTGKLFYDKGKEGTCRYCHKASDQDNRISFKKAAHMACIACHQEKEAAKKTSGPVACRGCHDESEIRRIKKEDAVPRMKRNQPDSVFVKRFDPVGKGTGAKAEMPEASDYRMAFVPFDHKRHETAENTCRVCHHAAMAPCARCHPLKGLHGEESVNLEQAMHQHDGRSGCVGCHNTYKKTTDACRGCHGLMAGKEGPDENQCGTCHVAQIPANSKYSDLSAFAANRQKAAAILASNKKAVVLLPDGAVPETVTIDVLENKYFPAELPHGRIITTLQKNMSGNRLASAFHKEEKKTCKACHHHSPESLRPPKCVSCHAKVYRQNEIQTPGLKGAYHQQCMGCHRDMGIVAPARTDCSACHKEKSASGN